MRLCKDLINKAIVTIDDGSIVGYVKDLYLTAQLDALAGIHIKKEGVLRRRALLIPAASVIVFGIDVVLINSADAVTTNKILKPAADWVLLKKLQGREVDTPGGTRVGTIGDVLLDSEGNISGYALSRVLVEGPIGDSRMINRSAVVDAGSTDGVMTINLERAENSKIDAETESTTEEALAAIEDSVDDSVHDPQEIEAEALDEIEASVKRTKAEEAAKLADQTDAIVVSSDDVAGS